MRNKRHDIQLWEIDPFCPVDWRARDANRLVAGERPAWTTDDPEVHAYADYLRALQAATEDEERVAATRRWPAISGAHDLAGRNDPHRWQVSAMLLAGQTDQDIATRTGLPQDVVHAFEDLFFSVRRNLCAHDWIVARAIGPGLWTGFRRDEVDRLWMAVGYFGGPIILEAVINAFMTAWKPGEPATAALYFEPGSPASLEMRAAIAAHFVPANQKTDAAFRKLHLQLLTVEAGQRPAKLRKRLQQQTIDLWRSSTDRPTKSASVKAKTLKTMEGSSDERDRAQEPAGVGAGPGRDG